MANKYLDDDGLSHFWAICKLTFATPGAVPSASSTTPAMDGTAAAGSENAWAHGDHVHPTDTSRAPTSHASSSTTYGKGTSSNYGHVKLSDSTSSTTAASSGGTAASPKAVKDALDAAKTYADSYANQNAFSVIKIGSTNIEADTTTDTLTLVAGSNVTITPDAANDKVTIAATDTTYSAADIVTLLGTTPVNRATADASGNDISTTYALKTEIAGLYKYKGSVVNEAALPASPSTGDVYNIETASSYGAAGANVAWNGSAWDSLGEIFSITAITNAEIDAICV